VSIQVSELIPIVFGGSFISTGNCQWFLNKKNVDGFILDDVERTMTDEFGDIIAIANSLNGGTNGKPSSLRGPSLG